MRVVVDTADDVRLAIASGADGVLLRFAGIPGEVAGAHLHEIRLALDDAATLGLMLDPGLANGPDEGFADFWFVAGPRPLEAERIATPNGSGRTVLILPASRDDIAASLDDAVRDGFGGILLGGLGTSRRLLTLTTIGALRSQVVAARARGLDVAIGGHLDVPDIPRLLAIEPDELLLDTIARDQNRASAPVDLDRLRLLRDLIPRTPPAARDRETSAAACDRIFVRDWTIAIPIGAYAHEREPQRVRFSVEADVLRAAGRPADLRHIVSYDLILDAIGRSTLHHVDLVETLAEDIARIVLAHPRVVRIEVTVEKLDLGPGSLGCRIVRTHEPRP